MPKPSADPDETATTDEVDGNKLSPPTESPVEDPVLIDESRYRRRSSPGMRAFEGLSMGGPERFTREQMKALIDNADEFVKGLAEVLAPFVQEEDPDDAGDNAA